MSRFLVRLSCFTTAMLSVAACTDTINFATSVEATIHPLQLEREGLDAAVKGFSGQDQPDGNGGTGEDTLVERQRSSGVIVRVRGDYPISDRVAAFGGVALSKGAGAYLLPEGVDVLTDPAAVRFSSVAVNASIGLAYKKIYRNGLSAEVSGGLTHRTARTKTSAISALLDANSTSTNSNQYAFFGAKVSYDTSDMMKRPSTVFVQSKAKRFRTGEYDLGASFGVGFH